MRIPLKWGTDSGEVGQRRSGATLVTAMISEVPHLSQESVVASEDQQHRFVSIISFLCGCIPFASAAVDPLALANLFTAPRNSEARWDSEPPSSCKCR